jgi:Ca2+-binding RTX toxin-like protein
MQNDSFVEMLESRRMLSAAIDSDGVLVITGTSAKDRIIIATTTDNTPTVSVTVNKETEDFKIADFPAGIRVSAQGGKDKVAVDETDGALNVNVTMYGGNGKDDLYGGSGDDKIDGGTGKDRIFGRAGDDRIIGWSGNDQLYGDDGDDFITGNAGVDDIFGGNGDDDLNGGGSQDNITGGAGNDDYVSSDTSSERKDDNSGDDGNNSDQNQPDDDPLDD